MTRGRMALFGGILIVLGAGWGAALPLTKIAVSTGYEPFGLLFWQGTLGAALMTLVCVLRSVALPLSRQHLRLYVVLALIGAVVPNTVSYQVAVHLPAGIMSLLLSLVPMFAFGIALGLGIDRFEARRLLGLALGLIGVMIILLPGVDLGQQIPVFWALLFLVTAAFYAFESNYIARWGTLDLDPMQVMLGASLATALLVLPLVFVTGQFIAPVWPLPQAQQAFAMASIIHVCVYAVYVWLAQRAGAVFAAQVSYLVTGFGLLWAWILLSEEYSVMIWVALATIFAGMYLVQPRPGTSQPDRAPI